MTVNKDELRELIESDLFGDGAFSLDDLVASEKKPVKKISKKEQENDPNDEQEKFLETDLSIETFDEELLSNEIAALSGTPLPPVLDDIVPDDFGAIDFAEPVMQPVASDSVETNALLDFDLEDINPIEELTQEPLSSEPADADDIIAEEEQSLESFFSDVEKRLDSVEQETFSAEQPEPTQEDEGSSVLAEEPETSYFREEEPPAAIDEAVASMPVEELQERINVRPIEFPELEERISGQPFDLSFFSNIPVKIDVYLGDTSISLKDVYDLTEGAIISLDKRFGEPLELRINGQVIAKGEVVAVDQHYGIMIKEIVRSNS